MTTGATISKITPSGTVSTFASGFMLPTGIAFDSSGNLYVANARTNFYVYIITPSGAVSTFIYVGSNSPQGIAFDSSGNLYVANYNSNSILEATASGRGGLASLGVGSVKSSGGNGSASGGGAGAAGPAGSGSNGWGTSGGSAAGGAWDGSHAPGAGGAGGSTTGTVGNGYGGGGGSGTTAGTGAPGIITLTWTTPPTCTLTLTPSTISFGSSATLSYTSSNATSFTINNAGPMTPDISSSFSVYPSQSTDYTGTVGNGVATSTCPASLTVTPPPTPTATIAASSTAIYVGQSTNLTATFQAGSGDTLTADNIDQPLGTGQGANTAPGPKSITFTPTQSGTFTFYARATTSYYSAWTTYASTTVTVTTPPSCTPAYTCSSTTIEYTNSTCQVSTIATCTTPSFCSPGSAVCLYPAPTFTQSASYSGHLQAAPSLVPANTPTTLHWDVSNVASCTVEGTDGETWSGTSAGSGAATLPITQQTTFTLSCVDLDSSTLNESVVVNVVPVFNER